MHIPPAPEGVRPHGTRFDYEERSARLLAILKRHGVAAVLSGHEHMQHVEDWEGVLLLISGGAGAPLAPFQQYGYYRIDLDAFGDRLPVHLFPRRQDLQKYGQNDDRQGEQQDREEKPLDPSEPHLVRSQPAEALREHLAPDDDVPPCGEDPELDEDHGDEVDHLPQVLVQAEALLEDLGEGDEQEGDQHPQQDLDDDEAREQLAHHHLGEDLDLLLALVHPVDEVDEFEGEVDDDGVEEEVDRLVNAPHVDLPAPERRDDHVEEDDQRHSGHDGGEQEDDRDQHAAPPVVRLDRSEDEPDIPVEEKGGRDADDGDPVSYT